MTQRPPPGRYHHNGSGQRQQGVDPPPGPPVLPCQVFRNQAKTYAEDKAEQVCTQICVFTFCAQQCEQGHGSSNGE